MALLSLSSPFSAIARTSCSADDLPSRFSSLSCSRSDFFFNFRSHSLRKISTLQPQQHRRDVAASASVGREIYQPFRPPPTPAPALETLSTEDQLEILRERRGLWFNYAVHVPSLIRAGFTPPMIDESTGMTGVEQNKIVVASQVRSSLQAAGMDENTLTHFDIGGAELLYELRILSAEQRKSAALFALERKMDPKDCRDLARAMKDYERRKREDGWDCFSFTPGDCLAFACYRQSKECKSDAEKENLLKKGLQYAVSEKARAKISAFLETGKVEVNGLKQAALLQVLRLTPSEAGTVSMPYVLPVVDPVVQELEAAPSICIRKGPFSVQHSETPWKSWVAVPAWEPLTSSVSPVAISYPNASLLPWKPRSRRELEEPLLVVADKHFSDLADDTYFLVETEGGKLGLQLGTVVAETGRKALGRVVLALRPPLPENNDLELDF